ncbi:MAG TPA: NADH-quinone oxidoreductase subunit N [Gemmatimonadaceae bacterium]|nr:NADH-quinone oxidoreductase subunit N [Gemmatimonadaceae bacterium]
MTVLDLDAPLQLTVAVLPELVLMGGAMILLLWAVWRPESDRHQRAIGVASIILCCVAVAAVLLFYGRFRATAFGPIAVDGFRWMVDIVILTGTIFAIALSMDDNSRDALTTAEGHVLLLMASSGMMLLAAARDLMVVFLAIELMSISVYALAAINRRSARGAEGALKYFLLGAFSTAFLLYGIALVYGATGTTNITRIAAAVSQLALTQSPILLIGIALMLVGFGFKVAAAPFHMWAPDVYDGAPSPVTAYMAATVKAAAFAAFFRVWIEAFPGSMLAWHGALQGLAIATMVAGNAIGLAQRSLKRLLAYSSIGHAGYLMIAIAAGTAGGAPAMLFYLFAYTLATFGAFAVVVAVAQPGRGGVMIDELAGLGRVRPWMALAMAIMMLALLGFPVFGGAGFFAKWYLLEVALGAPVPQYALAIVLVATTVVSAGYYLHVVMVMFMKARPDGAVAIAPSPPVTRAVMLATAGAILILGIVPDRAVFFTYGGRTDPGVVSGATADRGTGAVGSRSNLAPLPR